MSAPPNNGDSLRPEPPPGSSTVPFEVAKPDVPLSDILRGGSGSSRRNTGPADLLAKLAAGEPNNTDDSPTVITNGKPPPAVPPPPLPAVVESPPSVAGRKLGHFELIEAVGSGGMAAVLKARDLELGRVVALKILPPESTRDAENVTRFKQEARAAAKLDHENVARVYFCGEDQGLHFIAFEFVEGETLRARIDRGTLPAGECVRYMIQVAAGLNHAAERGVVHRDIKPSNIIITPEGRAKIVDMGLARHLDSGSVNGGVTQSGVTLGTFDYISPEQALDPRRADVRSDIYSLGCTFYHALTGRPPVPDGTAAKKLRAHQLIAPLDPRILNPAIPDELAAVLARMMAKDQEKRYQTPAELIAHLKGVAEKLKLSADAVSNDSVVRAVAADPNVLPEPPKFRIGWAVASVAIAAAVLVYAVTRNNAPPMNPPWEGDRPRATDPSAPGTEGAGAKPLAFPPGADGFVRVRSAEELAKALADPNTTKVQLDGRIYDLTRLAGPVHFQGKELELRGSATNPPRIKANAGTEPADGSLTFTNVASLKVSGVRFELVCPQDDTPLVVVLAEMPEPGGLQLVSVAEALFADCQFVPDAKLKNHDVASVVFRQDAPDAATRVKLERCLFAPGRVGLQVPPRSEVQVTDSGFGPHASAVAVKAADGEPATSTVALSRSSFVLDAYSAVVDAESPVKVTAGYCVFAAPTGATEPAVPGMAVPAARGVVVRDHGEVLTADTLKGVADQKNAYYRVLPIAHATPDGVKAYTFDESRAMVSVPADDPGAVTLKQRPWDAGDITAQLLGSDPFRAFRLKLTDRGVFVEDRSLYLLGAQFHLPQSPTRRAYDKLGGWPPVPPAAVAVAEARQLVWWPDAPLADLIPGTYSDIVKLLRDVKSGDEVVIRHNGPLPVDPARVESPARPGGERGEFRVTFKPAAGHKPVLVPAANRDLDATMFRLMDGEATFENLQFLVKPAKPRDHRSQAAVTLVGAKGCTFRGCVFTLEEDESRAAVVVVADADREMRMEPAAGRAVPKIRFENCLVRGKGRGVWVPVSRPFELDVANCVTAVEGELVLVEPAGKDPLGAARSMVRFSHLTALVGGPLVEMRGGKFGEMKAAGLVPIDVTAEHCLFAAVSGAAKPLVVLDGIDPADVERLLTWQGGRANRYANFEAAPQLAVIRPGDEAGTTKGWDWNQWLGFAREVGRPVGKVTFAAGPLGLRELPLVRPADVAVKAVDFPDLDDAKPGDAGAELRDVPRPAVEEKDEEPEANGEPGA